MFTYSQTVDMVLFKRVFKRLHTLMFYINTPTTLYANNNVSNLIVQCTYRSYHGTNVLNITSPLPEAVESVVSQTGKKKKAVKRTKIIREEALKKSGFWNVSAISTAEEYDLNSISDALYSHGVYQLSSKFEELTKDSNPEFIHAIAKYNTDNETRDLYIFREGSMVLWNIPELEMQNILKFIKPFEVNGYDKTIVKDETEIMPYTYTINSKKSLLQNGNICLTDDKQSLDFDKYTFSNVLALSVKLGTWESILDRYILSLQYITVDLKYGNRIKISRKEVLKKNGELFALRHSINLTSGLLDIPDIYWEREDLEKLYLQTCNYFNIPRRTRVINEKLNHCIELVDLVSSYLSDKHHIRLEWMIIALIMIEVGFETLHYLHNFYSFSESEKTD